MTGAEIALLCGALAVFGICVAVIINGHQKARASNEALRRTLVALGNRPGWQFATTGTVANVPRAVGWERGRQVIVGWVGKNPYSIQMAFPMAPQSFSLLPRKSSRLESDGGSNWGEQVGDEDFDENVAIRGDEADITATLSEQAREVIAEAMAEKIALTDVGLTCSVRNQKTSSVWTVVYRTTAEIEAVVDLMHRAADCLSVSDQPREARLLDNARTDSDPEVRARNIAMLALYHTDSQELTDALEAALGSLDEGALIAVLAESEALDRQVAAAIALSRTGAGAAVSHLREWASTVDEAYDYARRVGHQSVAAIQARVGPVEGGGLSLAKGTAGALSEAEGQGGELSVAEAEERRKRIAAAKGKTGLR